MVDRYFDVGGDRYRVPGELGERRLAQGFLVAPKTDGIDIDFTTPEIDPARSAKYEVVGQFWMPPNVFAGFVANLVDVLNDMQNPAP